MGDKAQWLILPLGILAALAPLIRPYTMYILVQPMDAVKAPSAVANFVWFFAGTCIRPLWDRWMKNASWRRFGISVALYAAIWVVASNWRFTDEFAWQLVPLSVLALFIAAQGLALAGIVPMKSRPAQMLKKVGQDTLPVYIFHIFMISIISAGSKYFGLIGFFRNELPNLAWLIPPVMVACLIPTALFIAWLIRISPLAFLLEAPAWLTSPDWPRAGKKQPREVGA